PGESLLIEGRKPHETGAAARSDLLRRIVGPEEARLVVFVMRYQRSDAAGDAGMPRQRRVLGPRQVEAPLQLHQRRRHRGCAERIENECRVVQIHRFKAYSPKLTVS